MELTKINAEKILGNTLDEIKNISEIIKLIEKDVLEYEKNKGAADKESQKLYYFDKDEIIQLKKEVEAKQMFYNAYFARICEGAEREKALAAEINANTANYLAAAKKAASNYRLPTEERNRFKKILKRIKQKITDDELMNLYLILKQELKLITNKTDL